MEITEDMLQEVYEWLRRHLPAPSAPEPNNE